LGGLLYYKKGRKGSARGEEFEKGSCLAARMNRSLIYEWLRTKKKKKNTGCRKSPEDMKKKKKTLTKKKRTNQEQNCYGLQYKVFGKLERRPSLRGGEEGRKNLAQPHYQEASVKHGW